MELNKQHCVRTHNTHTHTHALLIHIPSYIYIYINTHWAVFSVAHETWDYDNDDDDRIVDRTQGDEESGGVVVFVV